MDNMDVTLDMAVEQAADAIMITDLGGVIRYVNPAFERATGYSRREIVGQHARVLQSGTHDPGFYRHLWATLTRGQVWRGTLVSRCKDGRVTEDAAVISPLRNGSGRVDGYLAVKRDISRERQQALRQRRHEAMALIRGVTGSVAHEVNNLLMTMAGQVEMLESRLGGIEAASDEVAELKAACGRATSLTRRWLALGQRRVREPDLIDANEAVSGITKILRRLLGESIRVQVIHSAAPATVLLGLGQLEQMVLQVALRARDVMPAGGMFTVAIDHRDAWPPGGERDPTASEGGDWIEVRVSDTGAGIDVEKSVVGSAPVEPAELYAWEATYIVGLFKETLRRGGGHMVVSGDPSTGTTFTIFLPHVTPDEIPEREAAQDAGRLSGSETVLLAEDENGVRELVRVGLTRLGYRVLDAPDGATAMERVVFDGGPIDLLITDVVMPGMSGQELADRLMALHPTARIIYMSGYPHEIVGNPRLTRQEALFLQKPFTRAELARAVREVLERK
jgi:PAS domain S-box-containing protein